MREAARSERRLRAKHLLPPMFGRHRASEARRIRSARAQEQADQEIPEQHLLAALAAESKRMTPPRRAAQAEEAQRKRADRRPPTAGRHEGKTTCAPKEPWLNTARNTEECALGLSGGNHLSSPTNLPASCACPSILSFRALLLVREEVVSYRLADRMPQNEIDAAHAAFRTTANRQLRGLLAHGMEGGAASSCLLDDLLSAPGQGVSTAGGGGGGSSVDLSGQEGVGSSSPSPTVTFSSSSSSSLQYVVAQTGASPAHAAKILQLKEEISRMRRDGHSAVTVIEQLRDRLRAAGEKRQTWAGAEEDAERIGREVASLTLP